ncbi:MAG: TonB-dependent receptor, partial [Chlorobiales bacterium]|nr:TonB-dependent receptor [Chlorobiales bacterium]
MAPVSSHDFAKRSKSAFSPKSSVVYKPLESTSLRASVGSAFKGPSLSQLYSSITSLTSSSLSNPNLNPEKSTSWEIGVEHKFADLIVVQATYYESYLKDLIYYTTISTGITSASNAGKAEVKGVELEVRAPIIPEVTAFANATYNKSRITENTASPLTVGKWITNTPETMFNVGVEARMGAWTSFVTARYVGKLYTNDQNLDVVKGVYGSTDPYTIVNAKVIYDFMKGKSLSVAVDNLLDRTYYQNYLMPGRTF